MVRTISILITVSLLAAIFTGCGNTIVTPESTTAPRTTQICESAPPTTQTPTNEPPTTQVPTTVPPTTQAPTTVPPTTQAPTTVPPTTQTPTTVPTTTQTPTTAPPTTQTPTTVPPTTQAPTDTPEDGNTNMVWIPTRGGKKYHANAGCSNMIDPEEVTQEEAEALGFTPCKRCH